MRWMPAFAGMTVEFFRFFRQEKHVQQAGHATILGAKTALTHHSSIRAFTAELYMDPKV